MWFEDLDSNDSEMGNIRDKSKRLKGDFNVFVDTYRVWQWMNY